MTTDDGESSDVADITISSTDIGTIDLSHINMASSYYTVPNYSNITINTTSGANGTWGTSTIGAAGSMGYSSGLHVKDNATFEGDITWKGRSLGKLLESIEDRLAIIQDADPEKLEKFAALKKAYDHYKLLEKLCVSDDIDNTNT